MIGKSVGHYEIVELLGRGGMGVVYKARDTKLDRFVALKFLPPHDSLDHEAKQRFVREARAASSLDHANICTIHEIAETENGDFYIVMAHYEGQTLRDLLREGPLAPSRIRHLAQQLAAALERAHEAGIAHRDLKPANIFVTERDELKLLDFGLAKLSSATQLTRTGTTLGTVDYMSPEQAGGHESDQRTDIWSFGVVLHQMIAQGLPFKGETPAAVMMSILQGEPTPLPDSADPELVSLVEACLRKDPADRPDAAALGGSLGSARGLASTQAQAGTLRITHDRHPRRWWPGIAVLAVLMVIALVVIVGKNRDHVTAPPLETNPQRLAVTPFQTRGSADFAYLGEGLVDLLSAKLSGTADLTVANPRTVIGLIEQLDVDPGDPVAAREVALRCGAGLYITGGVVELGGRIQVSAYLHDSELGQADAQPVSVDGSTDALFELVDELVTKLLQGPLNTPGHESQGLASATTQSLPALKHYLEGEQLMRAGRYRDAASAYDRAVAEDPAFALAHYRKSIAADWIDAPDIRAAADKAYEFAERLPQPERDLVTALYLRRNGHSDEAQKILRSVLHQYPDEIVALEQLGEALFHENPRTGRLVTESMEPFRRAAQLEPKNLIAQIHLARIYAYVDSMEALEAIANLLAVEAPESERWAEVEALYAYASGDSSRIARLHQFLADKPWYFLWYATHAVIRYGRDTFGAEDLLELRQGNDPLLTAMVPNVLLVQGRLVEFQEFMVSLRPEQNPNWDLFEVFMLTSGAIPSDPVALRAAMEGLRASDATRLLSMSWLPPYWDLTERFILFERDYFVTLALIQLGEMAEAREMIDRLAQEPAFAGLGSINTDAVAGLRAEILYQEGDRRGALALLRTVRCDAPHAATPRAISDGSRWRLLRAELEEELGDRTLARNYYLGFDDSWSPWDSCQRAVIYQHLGQMAEEDGEIEEAVRWYDNLLLDWRNCDPELVPQRERIQAKRDALVEL